MKVYVAECVYHYEGSLILGVFNTYEKALAEGQKRRAVECDDGVTYHRGDELAVTEWEVEE